MRCDNHSSDISASVGVCASCLRERLFSIIAAQAQAEARAQPKAQSQAQHHHQHQLRFDRSRKISDSNSPPLVFPRSVSPYICRRKSDEATTATEYYDRCDDRQHQYKLFYSTPQVGPKYGTTSTFVTTGSCEKKQKSMLSFWSRLFRFRSDKLEPDSQGLSKDLYEPTSYTSSANSTWFSILSGRRKKQHFPHGKSVATEVQRPRRKLDRGTWAAKTVESEDVFDDQYGQSPLASGYTSESSQKWRQSPAVSQGLGKKRRPTPAPHQNNSGLVFPLSPLVRANPNQNGARKAYHRK